VVEAGEREVLADAQAALVDRARHAAGERASLDLDKAFGWPGASFTVSGLNRHGSSVDEQVGGVFGHAELRRAAQYAGLLPGRDADRAIFGFTYGRLSPAYSDARVAQGEAAVDREMMLELGYRVQFTSYLYARPDVQLVLNPGGTGQIDDAVVVGMQWGIVP